MASGTIPALCCTAPPLPPSVGPPPRVSGPVSTAASARRAGPAPSARSRAPPTPSPAPSAPAWASAASGAASASTGTATTRASGRRAASSSVRPGIGAATARASARGSARSGSARATARATGAARGSGSARATRCAALCAARAAPHGLVPRVSCASSVVPVCSAACALCTPPHAPPARALCPPPPVCLVGPPRGLSCTCRGPLAGHSSASFRLRASAFSVGAPLPSPGVSSRLHCGCGTRGTPSPAHSPWSAHGRCGMARRQIGHRPFLSSVGAV